MLFFKLYYSECVFNHGRLSRSCKQGVMKFKRTSRTQTALQTGEIEAAGFYTHVLQSSGSIPPSVVQKQNSKLVIEKKMNRLINTLTRGCSCTVPGTFCYSASSVNPTWRDASHFVRLSDICMKQTRQNLALLLNNTYTSYHPWQITHWVTVMQYFHTWQRPQYVKEATVFSLPTH